VKWRHEACIGLLAGMQNPFLQCVIFSHSLQLYYPLTLPVKAPIICTRDGAQRCHLIRSKASHAKPYSGLTLKGTSWSRRSRTAQTA
jgi:hypothetical protein